RYTEQLPVAVPLVRARGISAFVENLGAKLQMSVLVKSAAKQRLSVDHILDDLTEEEPDRRELTSTIGVLLLNVLLDLHLELRLLLGKLSDLRSHFLKTMEKSSLPFERRDIRPQRHKLIGYLSIL